MWDFRRSCCCAPSIHHTISALGDDVSWLTLGVRTSVELIRRGKEGNSGFERNSRNICDRTRGIMVVSESGVAVVSRVAI